MIVSQEKGAADVEQNLDDLDLVAIATIILIDIQEFLQIVLLLSRASVLVAGGDFPHLLPEPLVTKDTGEYARLIQILVSQL